MELTTYRSDSQGKERKPLAAQKIPEKYDEKPKQIDTLDVETIPFADLQRLKPTANTIDRNGENSANAQNNQDKYQELLLKEIVNSLRETKPTVTPIAAKQKQEQFELYQEKLLQDLFVDYKGDVNCSCAGYTCICCTELAHENLRTNCKYLRCID